MSQVHPLVRLLSAPRKRVVGLMSGTSVDGIDAALVEIEGSGDHARVHPVHFTCLPYSAGERAAIHRLFTAEVAAACEGSFWLGQRFADAALQVAREAGLRPDQIDLIGSHGQTVWHHPPSACAAGGVPSTLQLGEPAVIAARTGVTTVADFRVADVAHGGEGAPLVPYADWVLFRQPGRRVALQNIGGIANVSVVGERREEVLAFDNGPGNMIIDALAPAASAGGDTIDRDGRWSAQGRVQEDLLRGLLDDEFLRRPPPKSTGRERYGRGFVEAWARAHADRRPVDLLATAVAFTARAIAESHHRFVLTRGPLDEVLVSGGGAHNRSLMAALARELAPVPVRGFDVAGISADAKEAVAFALLAVQAIHAEPANLPQVTGAARGAVLGKICLA